MTLVYYYEDKRWNNNCKIVTKEVESIESAVKHLKKLPQTKLFGDSCEVFADGVIQTISYLDVFDNFKVK